MLEDLDWYRFANGDFSKPVRVCRLSSVLVPYLGAYDDKVLVHPSYAPKIVFKHKLTADQIKMMPIVAEFGSVIQDRQGALSFIYSDDVIFRKNFHLAIKVTGEKHEIWVKTFHKLSLAEVNRRMKRGSVLRIQQ